MIEELKEALEQREKSIEGFRNQEIELRKKQRELEDSKKDLELDVARKLDEEREKIRNEALKKVTEEHRLKDLEKDKVINDLRNSLEDMKRKAEQGSMETQGEVLEHDFEAQLKAFFVHDTIQPVPKGIRGADLVQTVRIPIGTECGVLLWETKNTKAIQEVGKRDAFIFRESIADQNISYARDKNTVFVEFPIVKIWAASDHETCEAEKEPCSKKNTEQGEDIFSENNTRQQIHAEKYSRH